MIENENKMVTKWLYAVCGIIMILVVFGGYVRLTRSGLSIVEWNPISGIVPPIGEQAWQEEFLKYQQSPEFQKINKDMTLDGYKRIFYLEYFHRLIARFAGLIVVLPIFYWLYKGVIPWRKSAVYLAIGLLFGFQGFLGWYMVSSGLVDNPAVSHYRLTLHLLTALLLLGLTYWTALQRTYHFDKPDATAYRSTPYRLSLFLLAVLIIQIGYGGFVAGLKAGYISNTFPLMYGKLIPSGLLSTMEPWWRNLVASAPAVHFIHRWFAFVVLIVTAWLYKRSKQYEHPTTIQKGLLTLLALVSVQITLGVLVIWFSVPTWLALVHQGTALFLFTTAVFISYQLLHTPITEGDKVRQNLKPTTA